VPADLTCGDLIVLKAAAESVLGRLGRGQGRGQGQYKRKLRTAINRADRLLDQKFAEEFAEVYKLPARRRREDRKISKAPKIPKPRRKAA
jgi:hypothetical protein